MQYFTTQLNSHQQTTHSLRVSQYRKRKKRRDDDDQEDTQSPEPARKPTSIRNQSHPSYASPDRAQLRAAGLLPEDDSDVPPPPFPHAPVRSAKERYGPNKVLEEIAKPPVRLYAVNAPSTGDPTTKHDGTASLRKNHLNVVSTLMHRCLLEQDYERAGRAWGMLLRTQVAGGHPVDPRNHGRWGIGAEVLLRRRPVPATSNLRASAHEEQNLAPEMFSDEGFELARDYYDRMIIQFPNRKTAPNAVDERTFYPAMFSLWIFEVREKSKRARRKAREEGHRSRSRSISVDSVLGDETHHTRAQEDVIQVEELARAMEIVERLDQLVASPPFDKQASLLQLRGHIGLWVCDLLSGKVGDDYDLKMSASTRDGEDVPMSEAEHLGRLTNCHRELLQAQQFFQRAEVSGAVRQSTSLASIDVKLKELARQFAALRAPDED